MSTATRSAATGGGRPISSGAQPATELATLLTLSAAGDTAAFAALYAATFSRAYGLAFRIIRDAALAEDVTQDAYLSIWRTASRYDVNRSTGHSWVLMIVHRVAVDHVRTSQARHDRDDRHLRESAPLNPARSDPNLELVHASLEGTRARAAVQSLTRIQRQALELAYFDGHTYAEVATLTGVPLGTAKARIRDALIRLRKTMDNPHPIGL